MTLSILASMCVILASCNTTPEPPTTDSSPQESGTAGGFDTESTPDDISFSVGDFKSFVVIRPEKASDAFKHSVTVLRDAIQEHIGVTLNYKDDFVMEDLPIYAESEYEILLGECARDECAEFYSSNMMRALDYGYTVIGTKILIIGTTDEAVDLSVRLFIDDVIKKAPADDSEAIIDARNGSRLVKGDYPLDALTVNGSDISDYKIVYSGSSQGSGAALAGELRSVIRNRTGYILSVIKDSNETASSPEFRVGATNRDSALLPTLGKDSYTVHPDDGGVLFYSNENFGIYSAITYFASLLNTENDTLDLSLSDPVVLNTDGEDFLRVMSFNIKTTAPDDARRERVKTAILMHSPTIVGIQEASPNWMNMLKSDLSPDYSFVGVGRDGGNYGEYNPIFYRHDIYNLLDSGTKWLSDTPDTVSKYEESSLNRIFTYAILEEKETKDRFLFINTHLEHTSNEARVLQAKVLAQFIGEYIADYKIIVTGDFNCQPVSDPYKTIVATGVTSSADIAITADSKGTFVGSNKVIDHIFISDDDATVLSYKVFTDEINGDFPSDHYPIIAELFWKTK